MKFLKSLQYVGFAPIDLKKADITLRDGWGNQAGVTGVTNSALEPSGETTVALSGASLLVPVGTTVHLGNETPDTEHTVTAITTSGGTPAVFTLTINGDTGVFRLEYLGEETTDIDVGAELADVQNALEALDNIPNGTVVVTGTPATSYVITWQSNVEIPAGSMIMSVAPTGGAATFVETALGSSDTSTDTITVSPALQSPVASGGTVTFTGQVIEVKIGDGTFNYDETFERIYTLDRGRLSTVRDGDETPVAVSFDFIWEYITGVSGSGVPTLEDALKQRGEASGWVTTSDDPCEPYCVDMEIDYDPGCGGDNTEKIVLKYFRIDTLTHSLVDSQISCTGRCNITEATATRGA